MTMRKDIAQAVMIEDGLLWCRKGIRVFYLLRLLPASSSVAEQCMAECLAKPTEPKTISSRALIASFWELLNARTSSLESWGEVEVDVVVIEC